MKELRIEYGDRALHRQQLLPQPLQQLIQWLNEASEAGLPEPNAAVLATSSAQAKPSSRTILVKHIDEQVLTFFTNYTSRKAQEIAANPYISLTFLWKEQHRQVTVEGQAQKTSRESSVHYWQQRPRGSQMGAWASNQGEVIFSRKILEASLETIQQRFKNQDVPIPDDWGGYQITPNRFEFWQGRRDRLHDRFQYRLEETTWILERISP